APVAWLRLPPPERGGGGPATLSFLRLGRLPRFAADGGPLEPIMGAKSLCALGRGQARLVPCRGKGCRNVISFTEDFCRVGYFQMHKNVATYWRNSDWQNAPDQAVHQLLPCRSQSASRLQRKPRGANDGGREVRPSLSFRMIPVQNIA